MRVPVSDSANSSRSSKSIGTSNSGARSLRSATRTGGFRAAWSRSANGRASWSAPTVLDNFYRSLSGVAVAADRIGAAVIGLGLVAVALGQVHGLAAGALFAALLPRTETEAKAKYADYRRHIAPEGALALPGVKAPASLIEPRLISTTPSGNLRRILPCGSSNANFVLSPPPSTCALPGP